MEKKTYSEPVLTKYGSFQDITQDHSREGTGSEGQESGGTGKEGM